MRRTSEIVYALAFFICGFWALTSGATTLFGGLEDINITGTLAGYALIAVFFMIKMLGEIQENYTKTLVFVGLTSLFGGVWGIGTIFVILSGVLMINRGIKQVSVIRGLPSLKELRQIRKERLKVVEEEEITRVEPEEDEEEDKPLVDDTLLEGFIGSDNHRLEIETRIDKDELAKMDLTPEEIRARAKQELRDNRLTVETMIALEELEEETREPEVESDLTHIPLDFDEEEEDYVSELSIYEEVLDDFEQEVTVDDGLGIPEDWKDMSIEDLLGD